MENAKIEKLGIEEEITSLLVLHDSDSENATLRSALAEIKEQFAVIQVRSQILITLGTITLTITGFSGRQIAASGLVSQIGMAAGLILVLGSILFTIYGSLRIRWTSQWICADSRNTLMGLIRYRDRKTRSFRMEVGVLGAGLASYVIAVVNYVTSSGVHEL